MIKKITGATLVCLLTVTLIFKISVSEERLMLCTLGSDIALLDANHCYKYFSTFGISPELVEVVQDEYGISAILSAETEFRFLMAGQLIEAGVNVNTPNTTDSLNIPPIHSTILQDDLRGFNWLLDNGANLQATYTRTGENAYVFLNSIYTKNPTDNRKKMIELISN
ncbi:hypothetical protein Q8W40_19660 [Vibrio penaeicida]|uniref:hypothetical protein n=1 Tax=Vibrio penaeicida TaxID=104609 RepID=UPI002733A162|nr:hypothetical protein [Vibrio penaeicida]MDP2574418.1 hypothetical protein [Vibrio penaeicida]